MKSWRGHRRKNVGERAGWLGALCASSPASPRLALIKGEVHE